MTLTIGDVEAAAATLAGVAVRTPVLQSEHLDDRVGAAVFCKAECLQRGGAFKLRGAYNKIASLSPDERSRGIAAVSSGNHAIAVALSAKILGTSAVILMPEDAPKVKVESVKRLGAEIVWFDRYRDDRHERADELVGERGLPFVPPYDDPMVMAGQGTVALELFDDTGPLDTLVVPMSGGGLMAGCATVATERCPGIRLVGVEPEAMDDTRRSLAAGERVSVPITPTLADGLTVASPGVLTFEINRRLVSDVVTVTDDQLVDAMRVLFDDLHVVVEPSGAAPIAALLSGAVPVAAGDRVGVVLSGGNVGLERFVELVAT